MGQKSKNGPSSPEYIQKIAKDLLEPIVRGESLVVRWFPGHGKTALLSEVFGDKKLLNKHLGSFYKRFIFVRIDGLLFSTVDLKDYFQYITHIFQSTLAQNGIEHLKAGQMDTVVKSLPLILHRLVEQCMSAINKGFEIVFVMDGMDDYPESTLKEFFKAWEYVIESNRERIHTHINLNKLDIIEKTITQSGLLQNMITVGLPDRKECLFFIEHYAKMWNISLVDTQIEHIFSCCGHDPVLIKEMLRIYARKPHTLLDVVSEPTLLIKARNNFLQLGVLEKKVVEQKVKTGEIPFRLIRIAKNLTATHFWNGSYSVPRIYEQIIIESASVSDLYFDEKKKSLFFGDVDLRRRLSISEHEILTTLFERKGTLVKRDEIGEIIWGKDMLEKYSEWAIDKAISRLRHKFLQIAPFYRIETHKKVGFSLEI